MSYSGEPEKQSRNRHKKPMPRPKEPTPHVNRRTFGGSLVRPRALRSILNVMRNLMEQRLRQQSFSVDRQPQQSRGSMSEDVVHNDLHPRLPLSRREVIEAMTFVLSNRRPPMPDHLLTVETCSISKHHRLNSDQMILGHGAQQTTNRVRSPSAVECRLVLLEHGDLRHWL